MFTAMHQPFKVDIINRLPDDVATVSIYRTGDFVDLCRGPHVPDTGWLKAVRVLRIAGVYWRGRCAQRAVAARVRHRLVHARRARCIHASTRGGSQARPPQARRRARPLLVPGRDRLGAARLPSQRRARAQADGGLLAPAPRGSRLLVREHPAHHERGPVQGVRSPRVVRRGHVPADGARRGHEVLPQAHELPDAHPHLSQPDALVSRIAVATLRIRQRVSLREVRCHSRAHARARTHHGRRAHLLRARADDGRAHLPARFHARPAARFRAHRLLSRALDATRAQGGRDDGGVGVGDERAPSRRRGPQPRAGARRGWRRLLRTEDLGAGARRHRAHVADVHDPGRLPVSRSDSTCTSSTTPARSSSRS